MRKINSIRLHELEYHDINSAVAKLSEELNMTGGSIGNCDLYRLNRNYLLNEEISEKINRLLDEEGVF